MRRSGNKRAHQGQSIIYSAIRNQSLTNIPPHPLRRESERNAIVNVQLSLNIMSVISRDKKPIREKMML